jgi:hypothetical protein
MLYTFRTANVIKGAMHVLKIPRLPMERGRDIILTPKSKLQRAKQLHVPDV